MKKQIFITAILALAGLSLSSPSAKAQGNLGGSQLTNFNDGDLLLGFVQSGNETTDYVLDIGAASNYEPGGIYYTPGTAVDLNLGSTADLGNIAGDLSSNTLYGSTWYTNTTSTYFSVVGYLQTKSDGNGTDLAGTLWTTNPTSSAYHPNSLGAQNTTGAGPASIGDNGISGNTSTANSDIGVILNNGVQTDNYLYYEPGGHYSSQTSSFNTNWSGTTGNEVPVSQVLYLDYEAPGASSGTTLGTFTVLSTGEVDYEAIPEPSTYASLALGVMVLVVWRMKRRSALFAA